LKQRRIYKTGAAFRTALEDRLAKMAAAENVDLQRLRRQLTFDRLLARMNSMPNCPWVLKGGHAMELRFRKARTTKDLDFTLRLKPKGAPGDHDVLDLAQAAAASDLGDFFIYRIGEATADLDGAPTEELDIRWRLFWQTRPLRDFTLISGPEISSWNLRKYSARATGSDLRKSRRPLLLQFRANSSLPRRFMPIRFHA
jgi:hypothetical protein